MRTEHARGSTSRAGASRRGKIRFLDRLSLRHRVGLMLLLPVGGLVWLSAAESLEQWRAWRATAEVRSLVGLSLDIGNLVHELQRERGRTSAFLAGAGQVFAQELREQRAATDRAAAVLAPRPDASDNVRERLAAVSAALDGLPPLRRRVDTLEPQAETAVERYSALAAPLIAVASELPEELGDPKVSVPLAATGWLARAKETAGRERALVSRLLQDRGLDRTADLQHARLVNEEGLLLGLLPGRVPPRVAEALAGALTQPCALAVEQLRAQFAGGQAVQVTLSAATWFDQSTCRIDLLRGVEQRLAGELLDLTDDAHRTSLESLVVTLATTLVPTALSVLLILAVARSANTQIRRLTHGMGLLSAGDFSHPLPVTSHDELGDLTVRLNALGARLDMLSRRERELTERERLEAELLRTRLTLFHGFVERVVDGDLGARLDPGEADALGHLGADLNRMVYGLATVVGRIQETSRALGSAAAELRETVGVQSTGASEQAAAVTQTVATIEQIRATSEQTLDKARRLGDLAERARREGEKGRQSLDQSLAGMKDVRDKVEAIARTILALSRQAQRIGEITSVVNEMSRQLRLLALNASVEATKAGEAGKGFAVVAAEVKLLAERAQQATVQVQRILQEIRHGTDRAVMTTEDGTKGVDRGLDLVEGAGGVIRGLLDVVVETSMASRQIAAAVRQEALGVDQIRTAMGEIHQVTNQFVGATHQTRDATADLADLADRLDQTVKGYQT